MTMNSLKILSEMFLTESDPMQSDEGVELSRDELSLVKAAMTQGVDTDSPEAADFYEAVYDALQAGGGVVPHAPESIRDELDMAIRSEAEGQDNYDVDPDDLILKLSEG